MAISPSLLSEGQVVAESYEIEHLLGLGGMGEVWLARHLRIAGKQVAIKVLRTGGALSADALKRFKHEAQIAARLEHPNIVQVLDFNTLPSNEPFLVMELLKGESLASRLRSGPLSLAHAQAVVRQVGSALQAAHAAGIVHRDLKPENIFLLPTSLGDQVKVLDFGISKVSDSASLQTTDSVLIGTPLYMSPEQATGQNRDITAQSDLFSLGSICYEMLTGAAPFNADSIARIVFRIAYEPHPPLAPAAPGLPASVISAVEHALVKDRAQRTPDIETFVTEFTGQPMAAATSSGVYRPGMKVTESMLGATVAHGQERATPAVPSASATPGTAAAPPPRVSRRSLFFFLSGAGALVAAALAVVVVVGPSLGQKAAAPPDLQADTTARTAPPVDAGVAAEVVDAGAEVADAGAGVAVADAGAPHTGATRKPKAEVLPDEDVDDLNEMRKLQRLGQWKQLYDSWASRGAALKSAPGRRQALTLLGLAACHTRNISAVQVQLNRLDRAGEKAAIAELRVQCRRIWPEFAL